jgi:uncharacterized protein (TIGR01777 family)
MQVAVTGSSGLIGSALCRALRHSGHGVVPIVRRPAETGEISWDPRRGTIEAAGLAGVDAVVHLAGAGIGDRRWTATRRAEVVRSRVDTTALLARTLPALDRRPAVLVSASAVGVYGDRGDELLTEDSPPGAGFLAELCRDWEAAAGPVTAAGIRLVTVRSGIVLSPAGGALERQLPLFRLGLGGRLGSGRQWTSWVSIDDEVRAILFALRHAELSGPVNVTAPAPVTNSQFTAALGRALRRPAILPVPAAALTVVLGRALATEMILASQRVLPTVLEAAGFRFAQPELAGALDSLVSGHMSMY